MSRRLSRRAPYQGGRATGSRKVGGDPVLDTGAFDGTVRFRGRADGYNASTGTLTDIGGEGNDATQGTSGFRPTLTTANGRAAMSFDGTDDRVATGSFASGVTTQPTTIYAVANRTGSDGVYRVICDGLTSPQRNALFWRNTNAWAMLAGTETSCSGGNATDNTASAFAATFNGATSVALVDDWDTDIMAGNPGTQIIAGLTIGAAFNGSLPWIGTINEVIVVEGASAADTTAVRAYFRDYYSLSFLA